MERIVDLWFDNGRIYITNNEGLTLSRPLEAFPRLKDATPEQRLAFRIGSRGDDVRWEAIDEDIYISSFHEVKEADYNNDVALIFSRFPQLNVSEVARYMGINKSLLSKYIYGIKNPSPERMFQIKDALHSIGRELIAV